MNILAIDFSSKLASAAVFSDGRRVAMVTSESLVWKGVESGDSAGKPAKLAGASALLTPLVHATIEKSGLKPSDFQLIALPVGPGLFTGLRVAVVTAKTFAYATGAEVIGLNTLEVLAAKAHAANRTHAGPIRVAVNAQRQQLFAGQYRSTGDWQVESIGDNQIVDHQAWVESWAAGDLISGAGLKLVLPKIGESGFDNSSNREFQIADQGDWDCDAASVAQVATKHYENGRRDDLWNLEPLYFRPSAAEENRMARHSARNI
jgi:tRNA threonylcarbamoyladenosine biosynthesis protein TsaB